jgi:hypothetical protein
MKRAVDVASQSPSGATADRWMRRAPAAVARRACERITARVSRMEFIVILTARVFCRFALFSRVARHGFVW